LESDCPLEFKPSHLGYKWEWSFANFKGDEPVYEKIYRPSIDKKYYCSSDNSFTYHFVDDEQRDEFLKEYIKLFI
jgi:hypothetical protein